MKTEVYRYYTQNTLICSFKDNILGSTHLTKSYKLELNGYIIHGKSIFAKQSGKLCGFLSFDHLPETITSTIDEEGHEPFQNNKDMYDTFSRYYQTTVDANTPLKIIHFKLIK